MDHLFDLIRLIEKFRDALSSTISSAMALGTTLPFVKRCILVLFIVQPRLFNEFLLGLHDYPARWAEDSNQPLR